MKKSCLKSVIMAIMAISLISPAFSYPARGIEKASRQTSERPGINVRIKDIATIQGSNTNQLVGYGLITGLQGTGDKIKAMSNTMLQNMFENMGMKFDSDEIKRMTTKNAAVAMVTADLPASFRSGDTIDVTVSSIGDATSIEGGVLIFSTLRGPDGKVYASAQGPISVGSDPAGTGGATKSKRLVGRIPDGGIICSNMDHSIIKDGKMTWMLRNPDYNTVTRVVEAINKHFRQTAAASSGDRMIEIDVSSITTDPVTLAAQIGALTITPDTSARIIINERTGTVIMGSEMKVLPVAISHGSLTLNVSRDPMAARNQPGGPSGQKIFSMGGDTTVRDVIDVLNFIGATPRDIIAILQALKNSGSLQGDLEII